MRESSPDKRVLPHTACTEALVRIVDEAGLLEGLPQPHTPMRLMDRLISELLEPECVQVRSPLPRMNSARAVARMWCLTRRCGRGMVMAACTAHVSVRTSRGDEPTREGDA